MLDVVGHWDSFPFRERALEILVFQRLWPVVVIGSALHLEYFEDLIYLRITNEQCLPLGHLCVDAANAPDVDGRRVFFGPQKDFWRTIPQCHDFVRVRFDGKAECPRQPKICELNIAVFVNEEVLWLQVAVHHAMGVAVGCCLQDLIGEFLYCFLWQGPSNLSHILLKIVLAVLEDQIQIVFLVNDFLQPISGKTN